LDVTVPEYEQNGELIISDIELASFIRQSTEETPFYKGGYEVLPNPSGQFGDIFPNLYFYYEIYNFSEKEPNTFDKTYQILDSFDKVIKEIPGGAGQKSGKTSGQIWRISVNDLPEGDYTLKIIITDNATEQTAEKTESFSIFNYRKKPQPQAGQLTLDHIENASGEELEKYMQGIKYIATKEELKALKEVESETETKEFLTSFWKSRNLQRMNEHYNLVKLANREFETFNKKGWETDMGRVFVKYGKPNDIERHPMEFETPAHQIWRYYELKGYFIFADIRGFGDFTLVDSNVPGEVSNPDWLNYSDDIIKGGKGLDEKGFK
jgi:GWxTD domain-containing protein